MRSFRTAAVICAALALAVPPVAAAPPKATDLTITAPPGLDWPTIKKVIEDGKVDSGDAVNLAFDAMWAALGNMISKTEFCRDAAAAATGHNGEFSLPMTLTFVTGSETNSHAYSAKVVPTGNGILAVLIPKPGGGYIKTFWCGNGFAYDGPAPAAGQTLSDASPNGAERRVFDSPAGKVVVWLPDDIRAGDTISGMVLASPDGNTPDQREGNRDTLNGYVLDIGGQRTPVRDGMVRMVVPSGARTLQVALSDGRRTLSRAQIPLPAAPAPAATANAPAPPAYAQAGRAFPIQGAFDGDAQNTTASIGGQPVMVVAESPRQTVIVPPSAPVGPTTIEIHEGQQVAQGQFRMLGVQLSAPKTTLLRGEQTTVSVQVLGLSGLTAPVSMRLEATGQVQLQGGNVQLLTIAPGQVDPSGRFSLTLNLQATAAGPFGVTARVGEGLAP